MNGEDATEADWPATSVKELLSNNVTPSSPTKHLLTHLSRGYHRVLAHQALLDMGK